MSVFQTADGRWIVGGERSGSEYKGFLGWRDCVIQLTQSGATERSIDYLNAFRDYALEHSRLGEPIMPPSVQIWISNNGSTSAVQADDMSVDGNNFTICGIEWNGTSWDYSGAGGSGGGSGGGDSGGGGSLIVHLTGENLTADKTFGEIETALNNGVMVFFAQTTPIGFTQYGPIDTFSPGAAMGGFSAAFAFGSQSYLSQNTDPTASDYPFFVDGGAG